MYGAFVGGAAGKSNVLRYGDVYVSECRTLSFTMSNHCESTLRFAWSDDSAVTLSPRVGHLRAGCVKDVTATIHVDKPLTLSEHELKCRVVRIVYDRPAADVVDWDDRLKTVKWITAATHSAAGDA